MTHLWVQDEDTEWAVQPLNGAAVALGPGGVRTARHTAPLAAATPPKSSAGDATALLMPASTPEGAAWVMLAPPGVAARINGIGLFFGGLKVSEIAKTVNEELTLHPPLSRESVYPLLSTAAKKGFARLVPPLDEVLLGKLVEQFKLVPERVRVVPIPNPQSNDRVAATAAELAYEVLSTLGRGRGPIGVGLGPGRATLEFSRHLGQLLRAKPLRWKLKLFAISAGAPSGSPEYAPTSFFNLFPSEMVDSRRGLFADVLVKARDFSKVKKSSGAGRTFDERGEISLVVTSMGDANDEHDLLRRFLVEAGENETRFTRDKWVGNVQYRGYSDTGPVIERANDLRAVTAFELEELKGIASHRDKHVLLIAKQCRCGRTKARALRPLLEVPALRVFTSLVLDDKTASELTQSTYPSSRSVGGRAHGFVSGPTSGA